MLETSCTTGIRGNEVKYITAEAAHSGVAEIALKGKIARSCFRPACVASCRNTPENKKSPRVKFPSSKAIWEWTENKTGQMGRNEKAVQIGKRGTPGRCAEPQQYGGDRIISCPRGKGISSSGQNWDWYSNGIIVAIYLLLPITSDAATKTALQETCRARSCKTNWVFSNQ